MHNDVKFYHTKLRRWPLEYNFNTDEKILEIINKCEDKELIIKILNFIDTHFKSKKILPENYRWQSLANHISVMIQRFKTNEKLEKMDLSIFKSISKESVDFSKKITDMISTTLEEEEVYLLSMHFEVIKK